MIGNSNSNIQIENLKSENIRKHVTILGVTGTYSSIPDSVDSGVFWTNPDDDGYYQDCEFVNYYYPLGSLYDQPSTNKCARIKRLKCTGIAPDIQAGFARANAYLEEVDLSGGALTSIGQNAFIQCNNLKKVLLPSTLTSIGSGAFRYNHFSEAVKLPASLTSIGDDAFSNGSMPFCDCTELTYTGSTPDTVMAGKSFQTTVYPLKFKDQATMEVYAQATNWSTYASRMTYVGAE